MIYEIKKLPKACIKAAKSINDLVKSFKLLQKKPYTITKSKYHK